MPNSATGSAPARGRRRGGRAGAALATAVLGLLPVASSGHPAGAATQHIIVQAVSVATAAEAVVRAGGAVVAPLPIVSGVAARIPVGAASEIAGHPGVRAVTPDSRVRVAETSADAGVNPSTINSVFAREVNADKMWGLGYDGTGVTVALIDTGVNSSVRDLSDRLVTGFPDPAGTGALVDCVDFSGERSCNDTYGHGTFVAGLIAGTGAASSGLYKGVAPGARILSVKIAGADGSADVSKVLAAIQWVVSFRQDFGIRVLNLSLGTNSPVSYRIDPLNFAVERAWRSGIVVVVSASNRGPNPGTISKPGDDPLVVTVGAVDDRETPGIDDDRLPSFSGRGRTLADGLNKPDVVAPGGRVISLRSPGSTIEQRAPGGGINAIYRRGSGTSMSAGVVSGVAALVLQARSSWTPDRVKFALMSTARKVAERDVLGVGTGLVDGLASLDAVPGEQQFWVPSDGTGSLQNSRGDTRVTNSCTDLQKVVDMNCDAVEGMETGQGKTFDAEQYRSTDWTGSSWYQSQWVTGLSGSSWYGSSWYGSSWYGDPATFYGSSWYGSTDNTYYGAQVAGSSWYGAWQ